MRRESESHQVLFWVGVLVLGIALLLSAVVVLRPDRPVADLVPGSSSGPAFVVQVVRPRAGLPLRSTEVLPF